VIKSIEDRERTLEEFKLIFLFSLYFDGCICSSFGD
jgi:hypothetical protein